MKRTPYRSRVIAASLLVAFCPMLVFWPGLGGGFIFDDYVNLVHNPALRVKWGNSLQSWWAAAMSSPAGGLNRPFAMLSFAVDHAIWGLDASAWKRTNLLLHSLNTVLTFALSLRLLTWRRRGTTALVTASMLTIAWAIHPLQVSTVLYAVQRMELLGHTFTLIALLCYAHARQRMILGGNGWPWLVPSALVIVLGVFAKETVAIAPALALALELTLFRFASSQERDRRWLKRLTATGVALLLIATSYLFIRYANTEAYLGRDFTWVERLMTEHRMLTTYIQWILIPVPTAYIFYYDHVPVSTSLLSPITTVLSLGVLLALSGCALWLRKKIPLFTLGIAWFFLGHLITAGPVPLEIAFEHRNYGPSLGILLSVLALLLAALQRQRALQTSLVTLAGAFIALSIFGTTLRSWEWGDPIRFISNTASRAQESSRAQHNFGATMIALSDFDSNNPIFFIGRNSIVAATELPGVRPQAYSMLIEAHARAGLPVNPEWWSSLYGYVAARGRDHHSTDAVLALVKCRLRSGCHLDDKKLQALLALATEVTEGKNPDILLAYGDFAFNTMEDWEFAERLYRASVDVASHSPHFRTSLTSLLIRIGKLDEAKAELELAHRLDRLGVYQAQHEMLSQRLQAAKDQQ